MKNKTKKLVVILAIVIVLIIASIVIPMIVKGNNNYAGDKQVLSGKTFTSDVAGVAVQGGMQNFGDAVLTKQVDAEGEDYIATIDLDDGYYESVQINAKPIYDRGVSAGVGSIPRLTSSNFSGTHSSTTAGAASNYTVTSTSAGYIENGTTVASLEAGTSPTIATTSATGVQTIDVKPGYYNKISVNQTNSYNKGKTDGQASPSLTTQSRTVKCSNPMTFTFSFPHKVIGIYKIVTVGGDDWFRINSSMSISGNTVTLYCSNSDKSLTVYAYGY